MNVERLAWDSTFFGFGVGRLTGPVESQTAVRDALARGQEQGLRLVYSQCPGQDERGHRIALLCGGRFVDAKRTYALPLPPSSRLRPVDAIAAVRNVDPCTRRQLRRLAWQSAEFSRYRIDPEMPPGSWRRMYSIWINQSLNGERADAVLVNGAAAGDGSQLAGMVTLSQRGDEGSIGLLAVDSEWRGRGIGSQLLRAAACWCAERRCTRLSVVTQGANEAACRAYQRAGYALSNETHVFHHWTR